MVPQIFNLFSTNYFCTFFICLRIHKKFHFRIWDFRIGTLTDLVHYGFGIYGFGHLRIWDLRIWIYGFGTYRFGITDLGLTDLELRICPATVIFPSNDKLYEPAFYFRQFNMLFFVLYEQSITFFAKKN